MKRQLFNIYVVNNQRRGARAVSGYTFNYHGIRCGVSNEYINAAGDVARGREWKVTELTTGAFFATGASMQSATAAGIDFINNNRGRVSDAIRAIFEKYGIENINPATRIQYDFLTATNN